MLQILNRQGVTIENIAEYSWSSWKIDDVNSITIAQNPERLLGSIVRLYNNDILVGSGIVQNFKYDKNKNSGTLEIYPLIYDLKQGFLENDQGRIVYYNDDLANIIEDIIVKYRTKITEPLLFIKEKNLTGIRVRFAFDHKNWLEVYNTLINEFLSGENYVKVDADGGIIIKNSATIKTLNYQGDLLKISYEKLADEVINCVYFDNGVPGDGHIIKEYTNAESVAKYGKRVHYIKDSRFKYIESVDAYIANFFEKNANPKISIESLKTTRTDIDIFDKIVVNNWEKGFDDNLVIIGKTFFKNDAIELKVGTDFRRSEYVPPESQEVPVDEIINIANSYTDEKVQDLPRYTPPEYIKETYIDSTEIRSPIIKGNSGYFAEKMLVGNNGIIIDGANQRIYSANYQANQSGWIIPNSGTPEFNGAKFRGDILAGSININNQFVVDQNGNARGNDFINKTILFEKLGSVPSWQDGKMWCEDNLPNQKVLWGYFGGDYQKQQISTSRMQESYGFDVTGSTKTERVTTWFQPRIVFFNGFFENISQRIYGSTSGQAGSVSAQQGFGVSQRFEMNGQAVSDVRYTYGFYRDTTGQRQVTELNNLYVPASNNWNIHEVATAHMTTDGFLGGLQVNSFYGHIGASNYLSPEVSIQVASWGDNSITFTIRANGGWRFQGNCMIIG